jgi:hypothetical protein
MRSRSFHRRLSVLGRGLTDLQEGTRRPAGDWVKPSPEARLGLRVRERLTAGDEARTRDPYLGKVGVLFCIQEGPQTACKRLLTPNFHRAPTLTTPEATLIKPTSTMVTKRRYGPRRLPSDKLFAASAAVEDPATTGLATEVRKAVEQLVDHLTRLEQQRQRRARDAVRRGR